MDRFIEAKLLLLLIDLKHLKSNMDRFIGAFDVFAVEGKKI